MAESRLICPECETVLKPARPVAAGKRFQCPHCGNVFAATAPRRSPKNKGRANRTWLILAIVAGLVLVVGVAIVLLLSTAEGTFKGRYQEGLRIINVEGKIKGGTATATDITIQDGSKIERFRSIEQVPEAYRPLVERAIKLSTQGLPGFGGP